MKPDRKRLYAIILVTFSLLLSLGASEIVMRFVYDVRQGKVSQGFRLNSSPLFASMAEPGSHGIHSTPEFSVSLKANSEGFRDNSQLRTDSSMAVLGDSYVWGTGVEENQRFTNLLEERTGWRVRNYGLCTSGTINEWAVFRHFVALKPPAVVLLMFYPNDLQNNLWWKDALSPDEITSSTISEAMAKRAKLPASWPDQAATQWDGSALLAFVRSSISQLRARWQADSAVLSGNSNWSAALTDAPDDFDKAWIITREALKGLKAEVEATGSRLAVAYIPYQELIHPAHWQLRKKTFHIRLDDKLFDFDRPRRELTEIARELSVPMIDLTDDLQAAALQAELYFPLDGHLTPDGHRAVADALLSSRELQDLKSRASLPADDVKR